MADNKDTLQRSLDQLVAEMERLGKGIAEKQTEAKESDVAIKKAEEGIKELERQILNFKNAKKNTEANLRLLQNKFTEMQRQLDVKRKDFEKLEKELADSLKRK